MVEVTKVGQPEVMFQFSCIQPPKKIIKYMTMPI